MDDGVLKGKLIGSPAVYSIIVFKSWWVKQTISVHTFPPIIFFIFVYHNVLIYHPYALSLKITGEVHLIIRGHLFIVTVKSRDLKDKTIEEKYYWYIFYGYKYKYLNTTNEKTCLGSREESVVAGFFLYSHIRMLGYFRLG